MLGKWASYKTTHSMWPHMSHGQSASWVREQIGREKARAHNASEGLPLGPTYWRVYHLPVVPFWVKPLTWQDSKLWHVAIFLNLIAFFCLDFCFYHFWEFNFPSSVFSQIFTPLRLFLRPASSQTLVLYACVKVLPQVLCVVLICTAGVL